MADGTEKPNRTNVLLRFGRFSIQTIALVTMRTIIIVTTLFVFNIAFSQESGPSSEPSVQSFDVGLYAPPSPEAAAMAQYGNVAVSMYTGSPNISIPVYTLGGKDISVPISLSYDASGIKVTQVASQVGLGWNLNAGGAVTRQIVGRPDDYTHSSPNGYEMYYSNAFDYTSENHNKTINEGFEFVKSFHPEGIKPAGEYEWYYKYLDKVKKGEYETQPDVYNFSINGLSGTIFIDYEEGRGYCVEHPDMLIVPIMGSGNNRVINGWNIYDSEGTKYQFSEVESTFIQDNNPDDTESRYTSAWKITQIKTERDQVNFFYTSAQEWEQEQYFGSSASFNDYNESTKDLLIQGSVPTYQITKSNLSKISLGNSEIVLMPDTASRLDLAGEQSLDTIQIKEMGQVTKEYRLNYSYFTTANPSSEFDRRLRLEGVNIFGFRDGLEVDDPQNYTFEYIPGNVASRDSFGQDYWGYYNGADGNATLIPYNYTYDQSNTTFSGANREPNFEFGKIGTLASITYPTGGTTQFSYQPHQQSTYPKSTVARAVVLNESLVGGIDPTDPFNFFGCDDAWGTGNETPVGFEESFISHGETHTLTYGASGQSNESFGNFQYILLYRSGDIGNCTIDPQSGEEICVLENDFRIDPCDYLHGQGQSIDKKYFAYTKLGENLQFSAEIPLPSGRYTALVLNSDPNVTLNVTMFRNETTTSYVNEVGGLRVFKVQDRDGDEVASTRYFHYGDLSLQSTIDEPLFEGTNGAGMIHAPADFEKGVSIIDYDANYSDYSAVIDVGYTQRSSVSNSKANLYMTYPTVSEIKFGTDFELGYTVTNFENQSERYLYGYNKNSVINGEVAKTKVFNVSNELLSENTNLRSRNSAGLGMVGFGFSPSHSDNTKETYIISDYDNPTEEYIMIRDKYTYPMPQSCGWNGKESIYFWGTSDCNNGSDCYDLSLGIADIVIGGLVGGLLPNTDEAKDAANQALAALIASGASNPQISEGEFSPPGIFPRRVKYVVSHEPYNVEHCDNGAGTPQITNKYLIPRDWGRLDQTTSVQYFDGNSFESISKYKYDSLTASDTINHYQLVESTTTTSEGRTIVSKWYYPHDLNETTLIQKNKISTVLKQERYTTNDPSNPLGSPLSATEISYNDFDGLYLPSQQEVFFVDGSSQVKVTFHRYDSDGNPTEVTSSDGITSVFLWAYNGKYLVARIDNTTYPAVSDSLLALGVDIDNLDQFNEAARRNTFATLRDNLPLAMITSYTYENGLGVSEVVDPEGTAVLYEYDHFGRLKFQKTKSKQGVVEIARRHDYLMRSGE